MVEVQAAIVLTALVIDGLAGDPDWLWRRLPHPVVWFGAVIARLDRGLNRPAWSAPRRRVLGVLVPLCLVAAIGGPALILSLSLRQHPLGWTVEALLAAVLVAQNSLARHVSRVAQALETDGLSGGRQAVSMIVGRNVAVLDEHGVSRAAIESLAENFSDGITAPVLWLALGGLPGIALYKAFNTADSMIGHRTERHLAFGWASARLDDLVNLPASRLTALLIVVAACVTPGCRPAAAWAAIRRDARHHRSPNAGWPEAAMAGALGLRIGGPRQYGTHMVDDHWMGDGRATATAVDIRAALRLYRVSLGVLWLLPAAVLAVGLL
ncbi:adenosylcobinamide-phosphate synthase CbiB [Zavarzinia sp. CC-PAN008]|uniref:adenosylcobinamide-phosphate synthase CbiB n=1 Tax=Zavarzinia sp. CC-PAN008 TaxID=3243332 RepID=UPI003F7428B9